MPTMPIVVFRRDLNFCEYLLREAQYDHSSQDCGEVLASGTVNCAMLYMNFWVSIFLAVDCYADKAISAL